MSQVSIFKEQGQTFSQKSVMKADSDVWTTN